MWVVRWWAVQSELTHLPFLDAARDETAISQTRSVFKAAKAARCEMRSALPNSQLLDSQVWRCTRILCLGALVGNSVNGIRRHPDYLSSGYPLSEAARDQNQSIGIKIIIALATLSRVQWERTKEIHKLSDATAPSSRHLGGR